MADTYYDLSYTGSQVDGKLGDVPEYITIYNSSGTLTSAKLAKLKANDRNYIKYEPNGGIYSYLYQAAYLGNKALYVSEGNEGQIEVNLISGTYTYSNRHSLYLHKIYLYQNEEFAMFHLYVINSSMTPLTLNDVISDTFYDKFIKGYSGATPTETITGMEYSDIDEPNLYLSVYRPTSPFGVTLTFSNVENFSDTVTEI